jgi:RNA-directed DNA polymerase
MDLMAEIACDQVLDLAYAWLCRRRERTSHNNDVWDVRWRWAGLKPRLRRQLLAGERGDQPNRNRRRRPLMTRSLTFPEM